MEEEKAETVLKELVGARDVIVEDLRSVMDKDIKIDAILLKTEALKGISTRTKTRAVAYKKQERNRNVMYCLIVTVAVLVFYFISLGGSLSGLLFCFL